MNESDAIAVIAAAWTVVRVTQLTLNYRKSRCVTVTVKGGEQKGDGNG